VGAGPAGLAAARELALFGYKCVVFDKLTSAGGMLFSCVPEYRLPLNVLKKDVESVKALGVNVETGVEVTASRLRMLRETYAAVVLALGAWESVRLGVEGETLEGVYHGIDFLSKAKAGERIPVGSSVAVIGGGNTALDAARTALRLGAKDVVILYRRSRREMPALDEEVEDALSEGVKIRFLVSPLRFVGSGKIKSVECVRMRLGDSDASGRRCAVPLKGSQFSLNVDSVVVAVGQSSGSNLASVRAERVFVCGDALTGPSSVVEAMGSGKDVAAKVHCYLRGISEFNQTALLSPLTVGSLPEKTLRRIRCVRRQETLKLPRQERKTSAEVDLGFSECSGIREAQRCLSCGVGAECITEKCVLCLTCVRLCPYGAPEIREDAVEIVPEKCLACGICVVECPAGALALNNDSIDVFERQLKKVAAKVNVRGGLNLVVLNCGHLNCVEDGHSRLKFFDGVSVVEPQCLSYVSVNSLLDAFTRGADGLLVLGCSEKNCRYNDGCSLIRERVVIAKKLLDEAGLGGARLEFFDLKRGSNDNLNPILNEFKKKMISLGGNPTKLGK